MPRNPTWTRDELILALDLYLRLGQFGPEHPEVTALSDYLRSLPLAASAGNPATCRNSDGVAMKLGNYAAVDPNYSGVGLERGGRGDRGRQVIRATYRPREPGRSEPDSGLSEFSSPTSPDGSAILQTGPRAST
jgi:hypothetical protein